MMAMNAHHGTTRHGEWSQPVVEYPDVASDSRRRAGGLLVKLTGDRG